MGTYEDADQIHREFGEGLRTLDDSIALLVQLLDINEHGAAHILSTQTPPSKWLNNPPDTTPNVRHTSTMRVGLADTLRAIADCDPSNPGRDTSYEESFDLRNALIFKALHQAGQAGYMAGIKAGDEGWPLVFVDLPSGQVCWHVPAYPGNWDGHTTPEKYERIAEYYTSVNAVTVDPEAGDPIVTAIEFSNDERNGK